MAGQHGRGQREQKQHREDDQGRMDLRGRRSSGSDIEHLVERRQEQHRRCRRSRRGAIGNCLGPDGVLDLIAAAQFFSGGIQIGHFAGRAESRIEVLTKPFAQRRACFGGQDVNSQPRGSDAIGFLDRQLSAEIEARRRSREAKRDEQPEQG